MLYTRGSHTTASQSWRGGVRRTAQIYSGNALLRTVRQHRPAPASNYLRRTSTLKFIRQFDNWTTRPQLLRSSIAKMDAELTRILERLLRDRLAREVERQCAAASRASGSAEERAAEGAWLRWFFGQPSQQGDGRWVPFQYFVGGRK